jgi:hypothetical protein
VVSGGRGFDRTPIKSGAAAFRCPRLPPLFWLKATDEYKPLLNRDEAVSTAAPLIEAAAPLLKELVNHASLAFRRCTAASDNLGAENEDLAPFILCRHTIELIDGIDTLFRSSCVDASVPLLRAALEASLSLDYIMKADYTRRSLAWTCGYAHARIKAHRRLDATTPSGLDFATVRAREIGADSPTWRAYDSAPGVAATRAQQTEHAAP